jgi:hypothetical protein
MDSVSKVHECYNFFLLLQKKCIEKSTNAVETEVC